MSASYRSEYCLLECLAQVGVKHFHLPFDQVPNDETIDAFIEILDHCEYRPVLIHCKHGEGRAVLFAAIYRMEYEAWSNERARRASRFLSSFGSFSPKSRKGIFIRDYCLRLSHASKLPCQRAAVHWESRTGVHKAPHWANLNWNRQILRVSIHSIFQAFPPTL